MAENIYKKLMKATSIISNVSKNLTVGTGANQYKAVGEADVLAAVKPIEEQCGIYSYPFARKVLESKDVIVKKAYGNKIEEKNNVFIRIETVYRFVNVDEPSEYIDITTYGDGVDSQDKAPGKAMTYSDKYALIKAYKIRSGEDPDQEASADMKPAGEKRGSHTQTIPTMSEKEFQNLVNGETTIDKCEHCGNDICDEKGHSASEIIAMSKKITSSKELPDGKKLCYSCALKEKKTRAAKNAGQA